MINDKHIEFARAVVALARENEMCSFEISFKMPFSIEKSNCQDVVTATWSEDQRPGALRYIQMKTQISQMINDS